MLPQTIKDLSQWVVWRSEHRDGKPTKIPYSPATGTRASSTAPETWAGYEDAAEARRERGYDGIGFVFSEDDDFAGVDLDDCREPETGEIEGWAQDIISELDSYTEISPSGTGVHIILRGELPPGRNRKGPIEIYGRARYFTMTEDHLPGSPECIEARQEPLEAVTKRVFADGDETPEKPATAPESAPAALSDDEVISKASTAKNGENSPSSLLETRGITALNLRLIWPFAPCWRFGLGETRRG